MKMVLWVCSPFLLCLISLPGFCTAEDSISPSPSQAPIIISPSDETIPTAVPLDPLQPSIPADSLTPPHAADSLEKDEKLVQTPDESVPPEPSESEEVQKTIADPIEPVNRVFFVFNDKLYFWVLKPVATGYKAVIPEDGRIGVRNFFSNLSTPVRVINCLLQAKPKCAGTETLRFVINTTVGVAGFFDPAKKRFHLEKQDRDFGQTLGIWGMGPVFYLDFPILGPSSLRDGLGFAADASFKPQTYLSFYFVAVEYANAGGRVLEMINEASLTLGEYENLKKAALDPYIALREAYVQYRQNKIKQ